MSKHTYSLIAGIIFGTGYIPYVVSIVGYGKACSPKRATWIIWAILDTILFAGMYQAHAAYGQIMGAVIGNWIVALVLLRFGKRGWNTVEKCCLAGAVASLILWMCFRSSYFSIAMPLAIIGLGGIPTYYGTWQNPIDENPFTWTIWSFSCIFGIFAISSLTMENALQPIGFVIGQTLMMYLIWIKPMFMKPRAVSAWTSGIF